MTPADIVLRFAQLALSPVLDLACGEGINGIHLATLGHSVTLVDRSPEALARAAVLARDHGVSPVLAQADLELPGPPPLLVPDAWGTILVLRYLHRPLIPAIRHAIRPGGLIFYETYTTSQRAFGKPTNPAFLLNEGELASLFDDWRIIHYFEGTLPDPDRAVAQLVARKS